MTLTTQYGEVSVELNKVYLNIYDLVEEVIKPVLLASGYAPRTIALAFGEEEYAHLNDIEEIQNVEM